MKFQVISILLVVSAIACSKTDVSSARRSPVAPPPQAVEIPKDLYIPVHVEGVEARPLTFKRLSQIPPH